MGLSRRTFTKEFKLAAVRIVAVAPAHHLNGETRG